MDRKNYCARAQKVLQLFARINSLHKGSPLFFIYLSLFTACSVHSQHCNLFTLVTMNQLFAKGSRYFFFSKCKVQRKSFGKAKVREDRVGQPLEPSFLRSSLVTYCSEQFFSSPFNKPSECFSASEDSDPSLEAII